jgi:hypothetical protein
MTQAYTHRFTEVHELGDWQQPMTWTPGAWGAGYDCMTNHQRAVYILMVGAMAAGATCDFQLWEAQDAIGTGAQVLGAKYITQLTQAGGDATSICVIELRGEELTPGYAFVAGIVTVGVNNVTGMLLPLFGASNFPPVPVTGWTEIVD